MNQQTLKLTSGTLTWTDGDDVASKTIQLSIVDDQNRRRALNSLVFNLPQLAMVRLGTNQTVNITIADNDQKYCTGRLHFQKTLKLTQDKV